MMPRSHPLAGVDDAFNAVYVEAEAAGSLMFYGPGAGGAPTARAVLGDLVAVARNRVAGGRGPGESRLRRLPIQPMGEVLTRYHISLDVDDRPGVLAAVAGAFAEPGRQHPDRAAGGRGDAARPCVVVTHSAPDAALAGTVDKLAELDVVRRVGERDASRRRMRPTDDDGQLTRRRRRRAWPGVIAAYRDRLPVPAGAPVVTLLEGGTPLVPAPALSERHRAARSSSRSRAPTRPARSRTAA